MPKRPSRHLLPKFTLPADMRLTLEPIGMVHSTFQWRDEAPRQATVGEPAEATIVLRPGLQNTLKDLAGFDRLWVLFWFNYSKGWVHQLMPPRDKVKHGLFATRAPDRPCPIGLSAVRIVSVKACRIVISGHDLLNGTPVLDLKPYIPSYDSFPESSAGWVDQLTNPGPDHRCRC